MANNKPDGDPAEPSSGRRVTLRDIAAKVGVSHVAVSLALRDSPQVSAEMREKIRKAAEEMDYRPDPMLSALAKYARSNQGRSTLATLAWINPLSDPGRLRQLKEFDLYWRGSTNSAKQMGYNLEEFVLKEIPFRRLNTIFKARNIRGILIAPLGVTGLPNLEVDWQGFPWEQYATVRFGHSTAHPRIHYVTSAQTANTMLSFAKIRERGYQRIGFVGGIRRMRFFKAGYYMAQSEVPKTQRLPIAEIPENIPYSQQLDLLKEWIKRTEPDAIIAERPIILEMLNDLDKRVPEDIGIATTSVHDSRIDAGIDQNPDEIGRAAVRILTSLINHNDFGIPTIRNEVLIEGNWVDGSMLPPRNSE